MQIVNCHTHLFTHAHTPGRFLPFPVGPLTKWEPFRRFLASVARILDPKRQKALGRYAEIIRMSYDKDQAQVFEELRGYYPADTRFVVLPMDMTMMNAGSVEQSIDQQHQELAALRDSYPEHVIPFAAVDPRHPGIAETTRRLIEDKQFRGLKLYPPTGYHPNDDRIRPIYAYAEEHGLPVLTHCSRPASVKYRGEPTVEMRTNPNDGKQIDGDANHVLTVFTDPDAYVPILKEFPKLRVCLAHFGGAGDWKRYIEKPWDFTAADSARSWLAKILDMLASGEYPNLWTDIAYTVFADDEYVYLLKVLLSRENVRRRVLFGSDFYVVRNADLEERRRAVRIRAVLGEELFQTIAHDNPRVFLGEAPET